MKKFTSLVAVLVALFAMSVGSASAALDATQMTAVQSAITTSTGDYYIIGGTILGVVAGIWAFKKLLGLLGR